MRLENSFDVAAPSDAARRLLNEVRVVLRCVPATELVEIEGQALVRIDAESAVEAR
jgi:carbon monoxide dehydrogenase subunit G